MNAARPSLADLVDARRKAGRTRPAARVRPGDARFARWHIPEVVDQEPDNWLLTYLDLLTLLLAMLVVMLGVVRMDLWRKPADVPVALVGSVEHGGLPAYDGAYAKLDDAPVIPAAWAQPQPDGPAPQGAPAQPAQADAADLQPAPPPPPTAAELGLDGLGDSIEVLINQQSVSFRISNELLFPSGQATLSPSGLDLVKRLAMVVNRSGHPLSVEGHSDNVPIQTRQFPSNWELSASRATSVLRELVRDGVDAGRLRAVGYADTHPLAPNDTAQNRAANRRVELIMQITPQRPDAAPGADGPARSAGAPGAAGQAGSPARPASSTPAPQPVQPR